MATRSFFSWLKGNRKSRRAGTKHRPPARFRPQLECLEDRLMPAVITVTSLADNLTIDSQVTLREAIQAAETDTSVSGSVAGNGADTITFAPSLFAGPQTINLSIKGDIDGTYGDSAFKITTPVTILGPTGANGLTLAGPGGNLGDANTMRLFLVSGTGNLTLDHLALTGGRADGEGNDGLGGAIYNLGTLKLTNSTLSGNAAPLGGGIYNDYVLTVTNSTVSGNDAGYGGGIHNGGFLALLNSTVTTNRADSRGGGLDHFAGAETVLNNTIVAGNFRGTGTTASDIAASLEGTVYGFNNLIGTGGSGDLTNGQNGNLVGVDVATVLNPTLTFNGGPTKTHALLAGANPAVNAGDNSKVPAGVTTDQRGFARISGGIVDIGAFEFVSNQAPTVSGFTLIGAEDNTLSFKAADFAANFHDEDADALVKVTFYSLPPTIDGVLKLNGTAVQVGQQITRDELNNLVFVPAPNFSGVVMFQYSASDGDLYASPATITLNIRSAQQQTEDLDEIIQAMVSAGTLTSGQGEALTLELKENNGDPGKVQAFLNAVQGYINGGILTQDQADLLLGPGNILYLSVSQG
jgi:Cadherin-like domain